MVGKFNSYSFPLYPFFKYQRRRLTSVACCLGLWSLVLIKAHPLASIITKNINTPKRHWMRISHNSSSHRSFTRRCLGNPHFAENTSLLPVSHLPTPSLNSNGAAGFLTEWGRQTVGRRGLLSSCPCYPTLWLIRGRTAGDEHSRVFLIPDLFGDYHWHCWEFRPWPSAISLGLTYRVWLLINPSTDPTSKHAIGGYTLNLDTVGYLLICP